jgi:hypothetical protein
MEYRGSAREVRKVWLWAICQSQIIFSEINLNYVRHSRSELDRET